MSALVSRVREFRVLWATNIEIRTPCHPEASTVARAPNLVEGGSGVEDKDGVFGQRFEAGWDLEHASALPIVQHDIELMGGGVGTGERELGGL